MNNVWLTWNQLNSILLRKKKVYIFGCSRNLGQSLLRKIDKIGLQEIIFLDNDKELQSKKFLDKKVFSPSILKHFNIKKDYIIISTEPETIIKEIKDYKLIEGKNFCCTPDIRDWGKITYLKENSSDIIFSSSDYFDLSKFRSSKYGGGLFLGNVGDSSYEKVLNGQYRQFVKVKDYYYVIEFVKGELHVLDKNFKILDIIRIFNKNNSEERKLCGITYSREHEKFFLCNPLTDNIYILNNKLKIIGKIKFRKNNIKNLSCHLNDITCKGDFLYVSYFSKLGKWRDGILDGGVSRINIKKKSQISEIIKNLKKPHSPEIIDNQVFVLDSLNGKLINEKKILATFSGFVRGLASDGKYFYIGQSEDMYTSKRFKISKIPIMLNAGIYQYDSINKITKFLSIPDLANIHDVKILS